LAELIYIIDISEIRGKYMLQEFKREGYEAYAMGEAHRSGKRVYVFSMSKEIDLQQAEDIAEGSIVFARLIDNDAKMLFFERNITFMNYFDDEAFVVKNAYLTAEGALSYIIQNTHTSIKHMSVLVLGYGRVGKSAAKLLKDNYAAVSVATDDNTEYALASIFADKALTLSEFTANISQYETIVNTIPQVILKGDILKLIDKDCFLLDLASKPGGIDFAAAERLGLKFMHALGIPGKTSPKTAAVFIKESILKRLKPRYYD
jgi:dipicolinate synthase subunit A